jgi:hypothetical protein
MVLPSRKKHTATPTTLPTEFLHTVSELFKKQFKKNLTGESFLVYGALHVNEVVLVLSLTHPKSLRAVSMHISMDVEKDIAEKPDQMTEQLKAMVDVAASWFAQCFQAGKGLEAVLDEMGDMDPSWQEVDWEGKALFVKLNKDNYALENMANQLLRKAGFDPEDDEDEDAELEAILNGDDEDGPGGRGNLH